MIKDKCEYCGCDMEPIEHDFCICKACGKTLEEDTDWLRNPIKNGK